jgi:hypothetical protein
MNKAFYTALKTIRDPVLCSGRELSMRTLSSRPTVPELILELAD